MLPLGDILHTYHIYTADGKRDYHYWEDINNRKRYFVVYAKKAGFDILNLNEWKKVKQEDIVAAMVDLSYTTSSLTSPTYL